MSRRLVTLPTGAIVALAYGGSEHAVETIVMCNPPGYSGFVDPDPTVTAEFAVRIASLDPVITGAQSAGVTPAAHAAVIAAYLEEARTTTGGVGASTGRVSLLGWGDGALVATAIALEHPGLVDRIALVAATYGAEGTELDSDDAPAAAVDDPTGFERRLHRSLLERERRRGARVDLVGGEGLRDRWRDLHRDGVEVLTIDASDDVDAATPSRLLVREWRRVLQHLVRPPQTHHLDAERMR